MSTKRNLVVVRAGDASLHPRWLLPLAERNWDLVVSYFGDDAQRYRKPEVLRLDAKGPKWPALHTLLSPGGLDWQRYERVWLPDDDLDCRGSDINRLFDLSEALGLQLAQPALSWQSHISHVITLQQPGFSVRYTSFVEVMAPLLSRSFLQRVLPTLGANLSGWGLDYLWPRLVDVPGRHSAIIDCVTVTHTRPVGGPNYAVLAQNGKNAFTEMDELLARFGITDRAQLVYGALDHEGQFSALPGDGGEAFVYRLCEGLAASARVPADALGHFMLEHIQARRDLASLLQQPRAA